MIGFLHSNINYYQTQNFQLTNNTFRYKLLVGDRQSNVIKSRHDVNKIYTEQKFISFSYKAKDLEIIQRSIHEGWNIVSISGSGKEYFCTLEKGKYGTLYLPARTTKQSCDYNI